MKKQKMNFRMEQSLGAVHTHTNSLAKEARGITLVALVVTIVVLLILAGVSINLVLGENGIITQAKKAKKETNEANQRGDQELSDLDARLDELVGDEAKAGNASEIKAKGKNALGKTVTNYTEADKTWQIFYADDEHVYLIAKEGDVLPVESRFFYDNNDNSEFNATDIFTQENLNNKYKAVKQGWLTAYYNPETKVANGIVDCSTEWLIDTTLWTNYLNTKYADWTIGGPTTDMFIKAYNEYYGEQKTFDDIYGYGKSISIIKDDLLGCGMKYVLGGNSGDSFSCIIVDYDNDNDNDRIVVHKEPATYRNTEIYKKNYYKVRPVVCLKSSAVLTPSADGSTYTVSIK